MPKRGKRTNYTHTVKPKEIEATLSSIQEATEKLMALTWKKGTQTPLETVKLPVLRG